ncbi:MDR family MFS transporter [Halococcus hamelinensis]|uniref:MDR family MFS transporter n=1 Tax=Halococcus hamelinensis TaxID=332168 RepID=UPI000299E055|nr:MDR family MFS transporter [Halococcus hamelinensis]
MEERERRFATIGVLVGIFLAAVDGTVVTTAMPTVVAALGGLELYPWVFTSYMLFTAVTMPLFGRLADTYGRKKLFYVGITTFVAGSVLSGAAGSMAELVAFRAVQGIGGGAMLALPYTILGVIYPPDRRGWAIGLGGSVWGVASVLGPPLGYAIVSTLGWRWVFYVNVPVGIVAVAFIATTLEETTGAATGDIDYAGALTITVGVGAILVGLELLTTRPLAAGVAVAIGLAALGGFYLAERRAREPIIPLVLFGDRTFLATITAGFLTSFVVFAGLTYIPLFVQSVHGGANSSAIAVVAISVGWSGMSVLAGRATERIGERRLSIVGTACIVVSFAAGAFWTPATSLIVIVAVSFVMGVGMGTVTPPLLTVIQNHLGTEQMGLATSSQQFFRQLGGAMGVSILGFVITTLAREQLAAVPGVSTLGDLQRVLFETNTPPAGAAAALASGLSSAFVISAVIGVGALVAVFGLPRGESGSNANSEQADPATD